MEYYMSQTSKPESVTNQGNVLRAAYNAVDKSITTAGFLTGKIGHKIERVGVGFWFWKSSWGNSF